MNRTILTITIFSISLTAFSQSPGGIGAANLRLWLKANDGVIGAPVTTWTDRAGVSNAARVVSAGSPAGPDLTNVSMNFNPAVSFTKPETNFAFLRTSVNPASDNMTLIAVYKTTQSVGGTSGSTGFYTTPALIGGEAPNVANDYGLGLNQGRLSIKAVGWAVTNADYWMPESSTTSNNGIPHIGTGIRTNTLDPAPTINIYTNGLNVGSSASNTQTLSAPGGVGIGNGFAPDLRMQFAGDISEAIVYNKALDATERQRVESYLSIKYGITLGSTSTSISYLNSAGTIVWTANATYQRHIAGIARDDNNGLIQKQSRSENANSNGQLTIGLGNIYASNALNTNNFTNNNSYLLWGDNGVVQSLDAASTSLTVNGLSVARMNRIWLVQNTGLTQSVKVQIPQTSVSTTPATDCQYYVLISASDATFSSNVAITPLTLNAGAYEVSGHVFPSGTTYLSFARVNALSGTVTLPVNNTASNWFSNCAAAGDWHYFHTNVNRSEKLFAISGLSTAQLNNINVNITTSGAVYSSGGIETRLIPRLTNIQDVSNGTYSNVKVRIYYNSAEHAAGTVPGSVTNIWVKYKGNGAVMASDIAADGQFEAGEATLATPATSGTEDGIPYVEFHDISSFSTFGFLSSTQNFILPVKFKYFKIEKSGERIQLNWATSSEHNNRGFSIERKIDNQPWTTLDFIPSKVIDGNSNTDIYYLYVDNAPGSGNNLYRLKQTDFDGKHQYSDIASVNFNVSKQIRVYPNPVTSNLLILEGIPQGSTIILTNLSGQTLLTESALGREEYSIDMKKFSKGIYILQVKDDRGFIVFRKILNQ